MLSSFGCLLDEVTVGLLDNDGDDHINWSIFHELPFKINLLSFPVSGFWSQIRCKIMTQYSAWSKFMERNMRPFIRIGRYWHASTDCTFSMALAGAHQMRCVAELHRIIIYLLNFQWVSLDARRMCLSRILVILRTCGATATSWCRLQNGYAATSFTRTQAIYSRTRFPYLNVANEIPIEMWLHYTICMDGLRSYLTAQSAQHICAPMRHALLDNSHDEYIKKKHFFLSSFVSCSLIFVESRRHCTTIEF